METKQFTAKSVKAIDDTDAPGTFEAIVAVFNNIDSYGDMILPGAFADWIAQCKQVGYAPPVWTHQWGTVPIGVTQEMAETAEGLYVKGRLFVDVAGGEDHPVARQVYTAMRATDPFGKAALREFSFAYDIVEMHSHETEQDGYYWTLEKLDVIEYGPCLKGANDQTRLIGVKSDVPPNGRVRPDHKTDPSPADPADDKQPPASPTATKQAVDLMFAARR